MPFCGTRITVSASKKLASTHAPLAENTAFIDPIAAPVEATSAPTESTPHSVPSKTGAPTLPLPGLINIFIEGRRTIKSVRAGASTKKLDNPSSPTAKVRSSGGNTQSLTPEERARRYWANRISREYMPFFEASDVPADKQSAMVGLLLEERLTLSDIYELGKKHALNYEQHSKLRKKFSQETLNEIKELLTNEQLEAFKNHKSDLITDEIVQKTVKQFHLGNVPYTAATQEAIREIIKTFPPGNAKHDPATTHLARKRLTPAQLAAFESVLDKAYVRK